MSDLAARNRQIVERFWHTLYSRDWEALPAFFTADSQYTDVPTPDDDLAVGPEQIVARLRLGLEPLAAIYHHPRHMVAEGDLVFVEHEEEWHWPSGEQVRIKFMSAHELRDGRIVRWWDYPDLQKLLGAAPQWWIEHIMGGYT
jgi:ketosteroid isomerase-like protein